MKVTKDYLRKIIKEELETEAFDLGTVGAVAVGVPLGLIALDLFIRGLKKTVEVAVAIPEAIKDANEQIKKAREMAEQQESIQMMVEKFKQDPEVMLLVGQGKMKMASEVMASKLSPEEKSSLKGLGKYYSNVYKGLKK